MVEVTDEAFQDFIVDALGALPKEHADRLENVAILYEYDPSPKQRKELRLRHDQTLFGLYQGLPLSRRQGMPRILPDKIILFKNPICARVVSILELKEQIRHTLWHEIAHYYGLNHAQIRDIDSPRGS
jgi:predicted Zn-dependent protease with MMP-like domain